MLNALVSKLRETQPSVTADAHCDGPCGVYDPADARIKAEAGRRIVDQVPDWKQRNMTAQSVALLDKGRENWDANDRQAVEAARAVWAWIDGIRSQSNTLENQVNAMNAKALNRFDPHDDQHWG